MFAFISNFGTAHNGRFGEMSKLGIGRYVENQIVDADTSRSGKILTSHVVW